MIAIQVLGAAGNCSRGSVQRRPRHQKRDSLKQAAISFRVAKGTLFGLEIIKLRKPLQVVPQMPR